MTGRSPALIVTITLPSRRQTADRLLSLVRSRPPAAGWHATRQVVTLGQTEGVGIPAEHAARRDECRVVSEDRPGISCGPLPDRRASSPYPRRTLARHPTLSHCQEWRFSETALRRSTTKKLCFLCVHCTMRGYLPYPTTSFIGGQSKPNETNRKASDLLHEFKAQ